MDNEQEQPSLPVPLPVASSLPPSLPLLPQLGPPVPEIKQPSVPVLQPPNPNPNNIPISNKLPRYTFIDKTTIGTNTISKTVDGENNNGNDDLSILNRMIDTQLKLDSNSMDPYFESLVCFLSDNGFINRQGDVNSELKMIFFNGWSELKDLFCGSIAPSIQRPGMSKDVVLLLPTIDPKDNRSKTREQRILEYFLQSNSSRYKCKNK